MQQVIKDESDIEKLKYPKLSVDKVAMDRNFEYLSRLPQCVLIGLERV